MITRRQVFRYSVAAAAAYTITPPVIRWLLSWAQTFVIVAVLSFFGAAVCIVKWVGIPDRWWLIYFAICAGVFAASALALWICVRIFCSVAVKEENDPHG